MRSGWMAILAVLSVCRMG